MTLPELVEALAAELGRPEAERFAAALARVARGERLYIGRNGWPEITARDTHRTLQTRFGISRSTAYQWLRQYRTHRVN